ncbi:hypothetical protein BU14_0438s0007 [Porphyra umbilicalis]|uniref:PIPK domain-containing protein n=1 Tax=Porphyra umbilicalis TaxID=2786 RepID=A0A1X6NV04_PORUM|nr:hypothetical protein BU14_0438s0007 [Porphyra umbilicalis]|eukprot:OSX72412.1 hypothetical protein BU14_0438s0007 [Porphyra umbilicalis]
MAATAVTAAVPALSSAGGEDAKGVAAVPPRPGHSVTFADTVYPTTPASRTSAGLDGEVRLADKREQGFPDRTEAPPVLPNGREDGGTSASPRPPQFAVQSPSPPPFQSTGSHSEPVMSPLRQSPGEGLAVDGTSPRHPARRMARGNSALSTASSLGAVPEALPAATLQRPGARDGLRPTAPTTLHRRRQSSGVTSAYFSKAILMPPAAKDVKIEAVGADAITPAQDPAVVAGGGGDGNASDDEVRFGVAASSSGDGDGLAQGSSSAGVLAHHASGRGAKLGEKKFTKRVTKMAKPLVRGRKRKVKDGEVVYKGHRNWEIVLSIQFGLRHTSEFFHADTSVEPNSSHFKKSLVFDFNPAEERKSLLNVASFASWEHPSPFVYRRIREHFGLSEADFLGSTCAESKVRELPTPGKSGALFYITEDESYFMKTVTKGEQRKLASLLPLYYEHVTKNPQTLLTKFLANFSVRTTRGSHIRMVVMSSIFDQGLYLDKKYDLKGSTKGRTASARELEKENVTLKDLDLQSPIFFRPDVTERLLTQLDRDSDFLERAAIMDYSLLLGMSEMLEEDDAWYKEQYGENEESAPYYIGAQVDASGERTCYRICLGIIDTLQGYTLRKQLEHTFKTVQYCSPTSMSVAPPPVYRRRFVDFCREKILPDPAMVVAPKPRPSAAASSSAGVLDPGAAVPVGSLPSRAESNAAQA